MRPGEPEQVVARNRKARHDYEIGETFEAGIVLVGDEVKSLREGRGSLVDGFVDIDRGEAWLHLVHIPAYSQSARTPRRRDGPHADPRTGWTRRKRKLLLHRREIDAIEREVAERGLTVVPLALYFSGGRAKVEIALARGRKAYDKRQALAAREAARETEQALSRRAKGHRD